MRVFRALFWKESHQVAALLVAMAALGALIMFCSALGTFMHAQSVEYSTIAFAVTALFGTSMAAILFSREHEEKTFVFLRSLPLAPARLAEIKFAALTGATLGLLIVLLVLGTVFGRIFGNETADFAMALKLFGVACIEGICWGIFWSSRCRKQITALLATYICVSLGAFLMSLVYVLVLHQTSNTVGATEYAEAFLFRLLFAIPFGIIGVLTALGWLRNSAFAPRSMAANTDIEITDAAAFRPASLRKPKRGEFRMLVWQNFAQSKSIFLYMIGFEILLALWAAANVFLLNGRSYGEIRISGDFYLVIAIAIISAAVFCATVFSNDQKHSRASILAELGISPGKIWLSRILPAAIVYFIPLIVIQLYSYITGSSPFLGVFEETFSLIGIPGVHIAMLMLIIFCLYIGCFCIGQMVSMFTRSMVVSIALTGVLLGGMWFWLLLISTEPELSPLWTVLPFLIACLIASRVYCERWLRKGYGFRAIRPAISILAGTTLAIMVAIPFLRVYSVPYIDLGYRPNDSFAYPDDGENWMERETRNANRLRDVIEANRGTEDGEIVIWDEIKNSLADPWQSSSLHANNGYRYFSFYFYRYSDNEKKIPFTPEKLKGRIKLMEHVLENPIPSINRVTRLFESEYRFVYYVRVPDDHDYDDYRMEMLTLRCLPWERTRALRLLRNQFQLKAKLANDIDAAVYHGIGNPFAVMNADWEQDREQFDNRKSQSNLNLLAGSGFYYEARPSSVYHLDRQLRVCLLQTAIYLWYIERGELPEKLEDLKGVYLKEIPKVLYYGSEFEYNPRPDGTEFPDAVKNNSHKPGVPYLRFEDYGSHRIIDLDFADEDAEQDVAE